jgi:hypothetical protein
MGAKKATSAEGAKEIGAVSGRDHLPAHRRLPRARTTIFNHEVLPRLQRWRSFLRPYLGLADSA